MGTIFLTAFAHFVSLCRVFKILTIVQFPITVTCCGDLRSVIFDVALVSLWDTTSHTHVRR